MSGNSFEYSPNSPGIANYFCMVHPWMQGKIIIDDALVPPEDQKLIDDFLKQQESQYPSSAPYGTDVTIQRDTATPGCENSNSCYSPYRITIDEGDTITWYNADSAAHTVTGGSPANGPSSVFDSSLIMAGNSFSHKFNNPGTHDYFCMLHPWMTGIVSVNESYTPPTYTPPTPQYTPPVTIPPGMNIVIPSGTGSPGCENSNSCYEPRIFIAGKYSTITWFNSDSAAHTVTSGSPGSGVSNEFDSGLLMSGSSFSHRFNDDGTYPYFCVVHPWMEGKVAITRSGTTVEAPTSTYTPPVTPTLTPTSIEKSTTSIIIDKIPDTAYLGDQIIISGKLTAHGIGIPNTIIQIKDLDSVDTDDLIKKIKTDSNGRFTITWTVREMESTDRIIVTQLINTITNFLPEPTIQIAGQLTPIVNDFKNAVESRTVEFFAHYPGNDKYEESFSCGPSATIKYGIIITGCEPKILVILSNDDSTGARVLNNVLINLLPGIKTLADDSILLSLVEDEGKATPTIEDALLKSINSETGKRSKTLEVAFTHLNAPEEIKSSCFLFWCW